MRTTLTLDPDVVHLIETAMRERGGPMKAIVNNALRRALSGPLPAEARPYVVRPHHAVLAPGFDPAGFNRLVGELEDEALMARGIR